MKSPHALSNGIGTGTGMTTSTLGNKAGKRRASFREIAPRPSISTNNRTLGVPGGRPSAGFDAALSLMLGTGGAPSPLLGGNANATSPWAGALLDLALLSMHSPAPLSASLGPVHSAGSAQSHSAQSHSAGSAHSSGAHSHSSGMPSLTLTPGPDNHLELALAAQQLGLPGYGTAHATPELAAQSQQLLLELMQLGGSSDQHPNMLAHSPLASPFIGGLAFEHLLPTLDEEPQPLHVSTPSPTGSQDSRLMDAFLDSTAFSDGGAPSPTRDIREGDDSTRSATTDSTMAITTPHAAPRTTPSITINQPATFNSRALAHQPATPLLTPSPLTTTSLGMPLLSPMTVHTPLSRSKNAPATPVLNRAMLSVDDLFTIFRATNNYGSSTRSRRDTAILCLLLDTHLSCGTIAKLTLGCVPTVVAAVREELKTGTVHTLTAGEHVVVLGPNARQQNAQPMSGIATADGRICSPMHPFTAWAVRNWVRELVSTFGWSLHDDLDAPLFVNANPLLPGMLDPAQTPSPTTPTTLMNASMDAPMDTPTTPGTTMLHFRRTLKKTKLKRDAICKILTSVKARTELQFDRRCVAACDFRSIDGHYDAWCVHFEEVQRQVFSQSSGK